MVAKYSNMREVNRIPEISLQITFNFGNYVECIKSLVQYDQRDFANLKAQDALTLNQIRDDLIDDGSIYTNYIADLFQDSILLTMDYFKTWKKFESADQIL